MRNASDVSRTTDSLDQLYPAFSCPQEWLPNTFLDSLLSEFTRSVTRLFASTQADDLNQRSEGLVRLLSSSLDDPIYRQAAGDPAFGDAYGVIQGLGQTLDALPRVAAGVGLSLGSAGAAGAWQIHIGAPVQLRWGKLKLPAADRVEVSSDGRRARIRLGLGDNLREIRLTRSAEGWRTRELEPVASFGLDGRHVLVLSREALLLLGYEHLLEAAVEVVPPHSLRTLTAALELLRDHAPEYLAWVLRVLRFLFVVKPRLKHIESGSIEHYFGFAHISTTTPVAAAELLVHEASHLYFHLLCRFGEFDDGTDTRLYYSPAVRRERPLNRIGVAYHAFANILLFYDMCIASGLDDADYCANNRASLTPQVAELEAPLRDNPALTTVGRGLCEPLMRRLRL